MISTEIVSLKRRNAPLQSVRKALQYNQSTVLGTSVYLIGTLELGEIRKLTECANEPHGVRLRYHIKKDLERGKILLEDMLEKTAHDESMIFPQQVLVELMYKVLGAYRTLLRMSEQPEIFQEAIYPWMFASRSNLISGLVPLCHANIRLLNNVD
ncbi:hypothetical protein HYT57_00950 [Candidatus Woesearchaeota archaeon]|nr:hypothetical protein [Candidatus Woesearchaeota archaeon]